jgi:hypothetical protein
MWKLLGRAAEDLCEPADSLLMRHVQELAVIKDVGQAVQASVRLRYLFRRPKVPSPSRIRQHKEKRDGGRYENEHVDVRHQSF